MLEVKLEVKIIFEFLNLINILKKSAIDIPLKSYWFKLRWEFFKTVGPGGERIVTSSC